MTKEVKTVEEMDTELLAAEEKSKTVVVDFFAPWCGPCKKIAPKLEEFEVTYPNVVTLKVNVDEALGLAEKYDISAMPTFLAFKQGALVDTVIGANLKRLEALYRKYGLDDEISHRKEEISHRKEEITHRKYVVDDEISPINPHSESDLHKALVVDKNIQIVEVLDASAGVNIPPATPVAPIDGI